MRINCRERVLKKCNCSFENFKKEGRAIYCRLSFYHLTDIKERTAYERYIRKKEKEAKENSDRKDYFREYYNKKKKRSILGIKLSDFAKLKNVSYTTVRKNIKYLTIEKGITPLRVILDENSLNWQPGIKKRNKNVTRKSKGTGSN